MPFQARWQGELPLGLRVQCLAPLTFMGITAMGLTLTLPPGPLCDEGMVLFMEGGCDWGGSNIFFFSKLGLLLAMNAAFLASCRWRVKPLPGFVPHLVVLGLFFCADIWLWPDSQCDTYYGHPNGRMGQMMLEAAAFALLGMRLLPPLYGRSWALQLTTLVGWNVVHGVLFYVWLAVTPHWTWLHTALLSGSLLALATGAAGLLPHPARAAPGLKGN